MGGIDVLVNNAGYAYRAEIGAMDVDAMRAMFETNVFGLVDLTNRVVPLHQGAGRRRHHQHRVDLRHERRRDGNRLRGEQVGGARHQPVLAGRIAAAWHPRHLRLSLRGADRVRRPDRPEQSEQAVCRGHRGDDLRRPSRCRGACCGRSWRCSPTIPGKKTDGRATRSRSTAPCMIAAHEPLPRRSSRSRRASEASRAAEARGWPPSRRRRFGELGRSLGGGQAPRHFLKRADLAHPRDERWR